MSENTMTNLTNTLNTTMMTPQQPKVHIIERIREAPARMLQAIKRVSGGSSSTTTWIIVAVCCLILLAGLGVGTYFLVKYLEDEKKKSTSSKPNPPATWTPTTTSDNVSPVSATVFTPGPAPVTPASKTKKSKNTKNTKKTKKTKKTKGSGGAETDGTTTTSSGGDWKTAYATYYNSYPDCCKESPSYKASADKSECSDYSGCKYMGEFAGVDKKLSYEEVKKRNIVSFYDAANQKSGDCAKQNKKCTWWDSNVKGKKIIIKNPDNGKELTVEPLDTCNDADTDNKDCTRNAGQGGGTLIDIEIFTSKRFWGGKAKNGKIQWKFA